MDDWLKDLDNLEKKVRNKLIRQAQKKALKSMCADIKNSVPVDRGVEKASVKIRSGKRKQGFIVTEVVISTPEDESYVGKREFGTRYEKADPVIRNNAKSHKDQVIETFMDELEKGMGQS